MKKVICNMCECEVETYNDFDVHYEFGYESKYDSDLLDLNLCGKCLDRCIDILVKKCKINPIIIR